MEMELLSENIVIVQVIIIGTKNMKKLLFMCALLMSFTAHAQVCKISDSNDNVEVFSCYLIENNSAVALTIGNDSQNISANVTITVKVTYQFSKTKEYTVRILAKPNSTTETKIPIEAALGDAKAISADVISITGTKCIN